MQELCKNQLLMSLENKKKPCKMALMHTKVFCVSMHVFLSLSTHIQLKLCLKHAGLNISTSTFLETWFRQTFAHKYKTSWRKRPTGTPCSWSRATGSPAPEAMPTANWGRLNTPHPGTESCFRARW